ncbi:hypothetical protein [Streptomyces sp. NPDC005828]|uniref:hypothetical protein n=1 Tax=Streptomyces sp. NPDC005828 TaxID=3157071 RepID=UPI0033C8A1FC
MKVVVLDDGSLMGVETAPRVRDHGHEAAVVLAPEGLDALTPQEVTDALHGCAMAVDLLHPPSPATGTFLGRKSPHEDEADHPGSWLASTGRRP